MALCIEETPTSLLIEQAAPDVAQTICTTYSMAESPPSAQLAAAADETPEFVDFALFAQEWIRELPCVSDSLASPALAIAWADTMLDAWLAARASDALDPAQPMLILDLAPGLGRLAVQILRRLHERLSLLGCAQWCIRYCALAGQRETRDALRSHPALQSFFASGWFNVISHWPSGRRHNPIVVLSLGGLGAFVPQLYAVHYGRIFAGRVAVLSEQNDVEFAYDWQETTAPAPLDRWLDHYAGRLSSAPLLLAADALTQLDAIAELACGRYLLLALDFGAVSEQQLREHALRPPTTWRIGEDRLPVNFELLSLYQRKHDVQTRNLVLVDGGWVMHAALADWSVDIDELTERLTGAHPDHLRTQLRNVMVNPADTVAVLAALRAAHYDPFLLQVALPTLIETPPTLDTSQVRDWRTVLERVWHQASALLPGSDFLFNVALFALHLGQGRVARAALEHLLLDAADDAQARYLLACCEATTGRGESALALLQGCDDANLNELRQHVQTRIDAWPADFDSAGARDGELALEPLDLFHANALLVQYRDREIGIATCLPELDSVEAVRVWLDLSAKEEGAAHYAVMHKDSGLVGVVGLNRIGATAYFYFWIGADYQGRGFGQRAGRLAFAQARANGIDEIFTSVYEDNRRSRQALEALGAVRLISPKELDVCQFEGAMLFYRCVLNGSIEDEGAFDRLQQLRARLAK